MKLIKHNESTASRRRVYFQLVDATDGLTAETGEASGQPQISIDGATWTDTGIGTLNAIGNGRYYAELTQASLGTVGSYIETRYKSANTAEGVGDSVHVIALDLNDATNAGIGYIDTSLSTRLAPTTSGLTLDVSSTGEAALDFSNIKSPTVATDLTLISIGNVNDVIHGVNLTSSGSATLVATIVDDVWDEAMTSHVDADSAAEYLKNTADILTDTAEIGVAGVGLANLGDARLDNLDALISSRSSHSAADAADAVWDEAIAGHLSAGSTGETLNDTASTVSTNLDDTITGIPAAVDTELTSSHGAGDWTGGSSLTAGEIASGVWELDMTQFGFSETAGKLLRSGRMEYGTVAAGSGSSTIAMGASANGTNNFYNSAVIQVLSGNAVGQARKIKSYNGTSKVATVFPAWITVPGSGDTWTTLADGSATIEEIADQVWDENITDHIPAGDSAAESLRGAWDDTQAYLDATISSRSSHSAADVDTELSGTHGAGSWESSGSLTVGSIVSGVWDEPTADHQIAGTTGKALTDASSAGDPWSTALPGSYATGTAGHTLYQNLDVAVSSRLAPTVSGLTLDVSATGEAGLDFNNIKAASSPTTLSNITVPTTTDITNDVNLSDTDIDDIATTTSGLLNSHGTGSWETSSLPTAEEIADAVWDEPAGDHLTALSTGKSLTDIEASVVTIESITTGVNGFIATKAVVDAILVDTAEIGIAGAGLTNINLPDQTMDIIGNITGNLSGSVGSVVADVNIIDADIDDIAETTSGLLNSHGTGSWTTATGFSTLTVADILADSTPFNGANVDVAISTRSTLTQADILNDATPFTGASIEAILEDTDSLDTTKITTARADNFDNLDTTISSRGTSDLVITDILSDSTPFDGANIDVAITTRSSHSASDVADAVWDEAIAGHLSAGSTGAALSAAGAAGDPWSTALPGSYATGTAGYLMSNLETNISSSVWNETISGHLDSGSTGQALNIASGQGSGLPEVVYDLSTTLGQLITRVRQRSEQENSQFVSDDEIVTYINASLSELYDLMINEYGEDYFISTDTITTTAGTSDYTLPDDFYKFVSIDLNANGNVNYSLQRFNFSERNKYQNTGYSVGTVSSTAPFKYTILGNNVKLLPVPQGTHTLTMYYVPQPPVLDNTATEVSAQIPAGWLEYVVIDSAIKVMAKEESDTTVLEREKFSLAARIKNMANNRDSESPESVTDVQGSHSVTDTGWF